MEKAKIEVIANWQVLSSFVMVHWFAGISTELFNNQVDGSAFCKLVMKFSSRLIDRGI